MGKITSYAELDSPADDDVLVIVDVSDQTMAPTGTTKKITVADLGGGAAVDSVNGETGVVVLDAAAVGAMPAGGGTVGGSLSVEGALITPPVTLADATSVAVNAALSNVFRLPLGGNRTLANPTNPVDGQVIVVETIQDGTGSRTLAYGTAYSFPSSIGTPVLSTTPAFHDFLVFRYNLAATTWFCVGFVPQQSAATPLTVAQGGTGLATLAAWELLAAGTTSTGALQQVGIGTSGQILTSGGAGALPSFQPLDATAADIQPPGNRAAGAAGKAADAGHVHAENAPWIPADNNLLAATDALSAVDATVQPVAGTLYLIKVPVRAAATFSNIWTVVGTAGVGTSTGSFIGFYSPAGTLLTGSSDIGTLLTTGFAARELPVTTPQAVTTGTFVWIGFVINMPTMPFLRQLNNGTVVANVGLTAASYRFCTAGTGLTALPGSITPASNTAPTISPFWFGVA